MADPITLAVGTIGSTFASSVGVTIAAKSTAAIILGSAIVGAGVLSFAVRPKTPNFTGFSDDPAALLNQNSNDAPLPIVYGQRYVGATRVFVRSAGPDGRATGLQQVHLDREDYLHVVYAVCEGPIQEFVEIAFGDEVIYREDALGGSVPGFDPSNGILDRYATTLQIQTWHGWDTGFDNPLLKARFPNEWTENHRASGVAYVYMRFRYNDTLFPPLPTVTFNVRGRRIRNVSHLNAGVFYSQNPADVIYDYLTHPVYGRAISESEIDIQSFIEARNFYAETHSFLNAPRYTINGALATSVTLLDNLKQILACCNSALVHINGVFKLIPFKTRPVSKTITPDDVVDEWNIISVSQSNLYNAMEVSLISENDEFQPGTVFVSNASALRDDNNIRLKKDVRFDLIVNQDRAKLLANQLIRQSRTQKQIKLKLPHTMQTLEPMDIIRVDFSHTPENFVQLFRVMELRLEPSGMVLIDAVEYDPNVFTDVDPGTL